MFFDRFNELCKLNNTTPSAVMALLQMSKGSISNWKKGTIPNGEAIILLAKHFNVSADYLLFGNIFEDTVRLTEEETELVNTYRKLDKRGQHKIHTVIYDELDRAENILQDFPQDKHDAV